MSVWHDWILKSKFPIPSTSILNPKYSILHPPTSNLVYPTNILHCKLFFLHPNSKVHDIFLKMSSKLRDFRQNVCMRYLHCLQLFPGLSLMGFLVSTLKWKKMILHFQNQLDKIPTLAKWNLVGVDAEIGTYFPRVPRRSHILNEPVTIIILYQKF